jgi:hypothetical protein
VSSSRAAAAAIAAASGSRTYPALRARARRERLAVGKRKRWQVSAGTMASNLFGRTLFHGRSAAAGKRTEDIAAYHDSGSLERPCIHRWH